MLKVLHTGDWHIGSFPGPEVGGQNARFQDICRCLDFQAMYAEEHRPDLIVVSGDIFHQARVWSDRGLRESRTAIDHIRRLSNVAPTVVLRGTPNHDSEEQFEMLTTAFYGDDSVSVVTEPEVLHIHTYHGQRVDVACIPGFDRGVHRAAHPGLSREEETQVFTDELAKVVLGLKAQCEPGVTSILSTHFTVPGCNMESGQTALFAQFEPVIYPDTLKAAGFDLVALGHIHRPQQLPEAGRAVFYCGSITGLNFNDEGQPRGFYIHDIDDDGETWSEYIETPYREFETIRLNEDDVCTMLSAERVVVPDRLKGKIVRVLYTCSDETNKAFNKAVLEKRLYDGGVFYVSEITPEEITTSVNRDELHGDNSPEQNLAEYLAEKEKSPEDAQRIIELARPIISEAMEKGRLETPTGVFMPVEIEVKNYRNYRDELFSYDGISFATINGENGAGKSSLFMDAMLDALFEEPREGDLTGWICNDPDARSGSIKFTFYLGDKLYRVTRTRTKSGKATLNLSEYVDESWQNRSAEKYRDTQTIIENTIGMDSLTLKATGLIMQDQYGLFLQADKADRMAILGNILGLGIYDRMESMAANRAADANRELRRIADLQEETGRAMPDKATVEATMNKLSERDLEERNTAVIKRAIRETFSKKANSWMDPLSIVIGENYCCSAFRCKISAKTTVWHVGFIGLEGDIEICVKIFRYAVRCIKSEQKKLRKQHRDYYTPQEIAKICDSYGYGFARGVYEAFTRQNEENQEYGLVLKVPKEVKDELEKIGPPKEFKKTPQPKTVGELDAAWRGVEDGRKFDPSNKLEEKKQEAKAAPG